MPGQITDILRGVSLFQGLDANLFDELAMILTCQDFGKGETIFSEGDPGTGFYVVVTGKVKIFKVSIDGKEQILHIFGAGEPFAEAAVFAGSAFPAHAVPLEPSRVVFFPRREFLDLIQRQPRLAMNMLATLSLRLKKFSNLIEALSLKEVPGRLAAHLLYLSQAKHNGEVLQLDINKTQLASLLGTIPETLSRIISRMVREGIIESKGATVTLTNRQALEDLASGDRRL